MKFLFDPVELDISTEHGFPVATLTPSLTDKQTMDNGYMMAAAPLMLSTLQAMLGVLGGHRRPTVDELNRMQAAAQKAISEAKGGA